MNKTFWINFFFNFITADATIPSQTCSDIGVQFYDKAKKTFQETCLCAPGFKYSESSSKCISKLSFYYILRGIFVFL